MSTAYLDDFLCIGSSFPSCLNNVTKTRELLVKLGFIINEDKSSQRPETSCEYLGFAIKLSDMTLELTAKKKVKIQRIAQEFSLRNTCQIREFAGLIGRLIAACPGVAYGMLYTKILEREKLKALIINDRNFDKQMFINSKVKEELRWWISRLPRSACPIRTFKFQQEIFSDASLTGWGAHANGENIQGFWTVSEGKLHINHLELIAAFLALKAFARDYVGSELLLRIDNTTAIAYINRAGGVQFPELNKLARNIWQWCEKRRNWIFASYIPSRENTDTDRESRRSNIDTEWELSDNVFEKIIQRWGTPSIDLFATRANAKVYKYCAWKRP